MARFTQYAVVASREALTDSGLTIDETNANRVGVWIGSGIGVWKHLNKHMIN